MSSPIRYLNTDLDLVSGSDLSGLASAFQALGFESFPLRRDGDGRFYATIESFVDENEVPEETIGAMLDAVESLDAASRAAWSGCTVRELNIGYDCGTEPWAFNQGLSNELLRRVAAAGASVRITLYPPEETVGSSISGPDAATSDGTALEIDVSSVGSSEELHDLLARRLEFPAGYGRNWDAFWDCISGAPDWKLPTTIRVIGWFSLLEKLPRDARLLRETLSDLPAERHAMRIVWVGPPR